MQSALVEAKLGSGRHRGQVVASLILCADAGYKESISNQAGLSFQISALGHSGYSS